MFSFQLSDYKQNQQHCALFSFKERETHPILGSRRSTSSRSSRGGRSRHPGPLKICRNPNIQGGPPSRSRKLSFWFRWTVIMAANVLLPILFPLSDELDFPNVTKFLRIGLADKNDHPPFFEQSLYEVELEEDEAVNQSLLTLSARDLDEASRMFYEIVEGNEDKTFVIGNVTGVLYLAKPLDYEKRKKASRMDNLGFYIRR
ncbi:cadherin-20-like [Macrobrachium nipponense]|uniref:cadherin-20-like n=1 Tax=Macrobrachium nipponense TaxID=159736 RepID=UPI0030C82F3B